MKCPKCGESEDIKFFIRYQEREGDEEGTGNTITIIHANSKCGYNESRFLVDILDDIFKEWSEGRIEDQLVGILGGLLGESNLGDLDFDRLVEAGEELKDDFSLWKEVLFSQEEEEEENRRILEECSVRG